MNPDPFDTDSSKCIKIQNVRAENLSITLLIIEFHHYRDNYNKTFSCNWCSGAISALKFWINK